MRRIAILGSTGSIGQQTLEVVARHRERFQVVALAAHRNEAQLRAQVEATGAGAACLTGAPPAGLGASDAPKLPGQWFAGPSGLLEMLASARPQVVVNAITGAAGLRANLAAIEVGADLAIANKESLVVAGELLVAAAARAGVALLPIDSEHSALLQCLRAGRRDELRRIILTASGGPFRGFSPTQLSAVTPEQALRHPTWNMGPKISVDSATLMNKGLEMLEAQVLFGLSSEQIAVVIHPQSIVHSLVEYHDGSLIGHLGATDMKIPIQYALSHPRRWPGDDRPFSLTEAGRLDFEDPDPVAFPALRLARNVCATGGSSRVVFNAANEVAVELFLRGRIPFPSICGLVERSLDEHETTPIEDLDQVLAIDRTVRETLRQWS